MLENEKEARHAHMQGQRHTHVRTHTSFIVFRDQDVSHLLPGICHQGVVPVDGVSLGIGHLFFNNGWKEVWVLCQGLCMGVWVYGMNVLCENK